MYQMPGYSVGYHCSMDMKDKPNYFMIGNKIKKKNIAALGKGELYAFLMSLGNVSCM